MLNLAIKEHLLSNEESSYLYKIADGWSAWESRDHAYWDNRVASVWTMSNLLKDDIYVCNIFEKIILDLRNLIKNFYQIDEEVYVDTFDLVKWHPGQLLTPHVDEIPHKHRKWGSVIYINDDYFGGETFYPNHEYVVSPKAGMGVVHKGDADHLHGVTQVLGKPRYTLASFWGTKKIKASPSSLKYYKNESITQ